METINRVAAMPKTVTPFMHHKNIIHTNHESDYSKYYLQKGKWNKYQKAEFNIKTKLYIINLREKEQF